MAPRPLRHPLVERDSRARDRALAAHPSAISRRVPAPVVPIRRDREEGSMTTEYGLLVVVGATFTSLIIKWASGGAVFDLLGTVLKSVKGIVGL